MRLFTIIAAAMLALGPLASATAASISKSEISKILSDQGLNVRDLNSTTLIVDYQGYNILVAINGADADVSYLTYIPGISSSDIGYQFLNKFNNEVKFGRAYIDRDGDIAIQMDRNSSGGVSAENIESDFEVFLLLIGKFLSDLESQSVA